MPVAGTRGAEDRGEALYERRIGPSRELCWGPACAPRAYVALPRRFCSSRCLHDALAEVDPRFADDRLIGVGVHGG